MKKEKIKKLEKKGWKVGTAADFLNLSSEEEEYIEMKLALSCREFPLRLFPGNAFARCKVPY